MTEVYAVVDGFGEIIAMYVDENEAQKHLDRSQSHANQISSECHECVVTYTVYNSVDESGY